MKKAKQLLNRYKFFLIFLVINVAFLFLVPEMGRTSFQMTTINLKEMLLIIPPIFVLIGLLDVWVERETMMKIMGEGTGFKGGLIAFIMGSAAAGPLYAAFPIAGILLKKGVRLRNVFIFIGAWSTTKVPMLLFEVTNFGAEFTMLRLGLNLVGIYLIAFILERTLKVKDISVIYEKAKEL